MFIGDCLLLKKSAETVNKQTKYPNEQRSLVKRQQLLKTVFLENMDENQTFLSKIRDKSNNMDTEVL